MDQAYALSGDAFARRLFFGPIRSDWVEKIEETESPPIEILKECKCDLSLSAEESD